MQSCAISIIGNETIRNIKNGSVLPLGIQAQKRSAAIHLDENSIVLNFIGLYSVHAIFTVEPEHICSIKIQAYLDGNAVPEANVSCETDSSITMPLCFVVERNAKAKSVLSFIITAENPVSLICSSVSLILI